MKKNKRFLPLEIDSKRVYAGFWKRFCSIWADTFLLLPFTLLFAWIEGFNRTLAFVLVVPSTLLFSFYNIYFNARFGATPGKLAVGIRITRPDGEKIGWKEAWLRSSVDLIFAFIILGLIFWALIVIDPLEYANAGFLQHQHLVVSYFPGWFQGVIVGQQLWLWSEVVILLLNRRKRALHDFIAGTVVVQKEFVGIMSRRTFIDADDVKIGRSGLNIALTAVVIGIVIIFGSIILCYSVWMYGNKDYPPPDTFALAIDRPAVPDIANAYTYFNAATNELFWPTNASTVVDILSGKKWDDELVRLLIVNNDDTVEINELNLEGKSKLSLIMSGNVIGKLLEGLVLPNLSGILERKCNIECSAAATRLMLACNAYKMYKHELPDSLEALVPEYINSIPCDPYDGKPFKYSKSKAIVYSVGKDLMDSGGSAELPANEKSSHDYDKKWNAQDIVFAIEKTTQ